MAILLGPPEIYNSNHNNAPSSTVITSSNPFMDLMVAYFNKTRTLHQNTGFTENNSPTFLSTGDPCLDFFFHVVPDTPPSSLTQRLQLAWSHKPLTTLKLVYNLRGVRGTGKSDKEGLYAAAIWLYTYHPKTLAFNVPSVSEFGYFKDLLEMLYRILEGLDVRKLQKEEWLRIKGVSLYKEDKKTMSTKEKERARATRQDKRIAMAKKVVQRYESDPNFRLLYDHI